MANIKTIRKKVSQQIAEPSQTKPTRPAPEIDETELPPLPFYVHDVLAGGFADDFDPDLNPASTAPKPPTETVPPPQLHLLPLLPLRGLVLFPKTIIPLTIGQERSLKLMEHVLKGDRLMGVFSTFDPDLEAPGPDDLQVLGTLATINHVFRAPDGTLRVLLEGLGRARRHSHTEVEPFLQAQLDILPDEDETGAQVDVLLRTVADLFTQLVELLPNVPPEVLTSAIKPEAPLQTLYSVATYFQLPLKEQMALLEMEGIEAKLTFLARLLGKELEVLQLGRKIQSDAQSEIEKTQRDYYLREQMKAIQKELGEADEQTAEIAAFREKIAAAQLPEEAKKEAERELERLSRLPPMVAEYGLIRSYLDWLVELPWNKRTEDKLDLQQARQILEEDHYGLNEIKTRLVEFLAVRKLRLERAERLKAAADQAKSDEVRRIREGVILCFVGPPGVGKTSLGASIARAMGRKFIRISLGGVRDEAEIRGFRRTYVGAMPGRIIQHLRRVQTANPIIMLDEVDKLGRDFRGDPAAALLEVLDPEQNVEFRDHYLEVPFDLSQVIFITTANELDPIPAPLRDRMEIIHLSGYTEAEKEQIARHYLIPRQIRENALLPPEISFQTGAILKLIREYTREAGVRNLEREIGRVARKVAMQVAAGHEEPVLVDEARVQDLLGHPHGAYRNEVQERVDRPGVALGLAWTPMGGDILFVEAAQMPGAKGFQYTGQLGEVMQESARAAFSYVRSRRQELGIEQAYFEHHDLHLHVPAGAIPKDGPSAGVTMAAALVSLISGRRMRPQLAMTGEITLRGQVLPVGGIKEKVLAADRFGIETVILPKRNQADLADLPEEVRARMQFILVESMEEVLGAALAPTEGLREV